jgi:hypothetical protein
MLCCNLCMDVKDRHVHACMCTPKVMFMSVSHVYAHMCMYMCMYGAIVLVAALKSVESIACPLSFLDLEDQRARLSHHPGHRARGLAPGPHHLDPRTIAAYGCIAVQRTQACLDVTRRLKARAPLRRVFG